MNVATIITLLRYALQALGGYLVANGKFSAENWETISGAVLVLLPALFGTLASNAPKVVADGKTVAVKDLPVTVQQDIKKAAAAAPKAGILEQLLGVFFTRR